MCLARKKNMLKATPKSIQRALMPCINVFLLDCLEMIYCQTCFCHQMSVKWHFHGIVIIIINTILDTQSNVHQVHVYTLPGTQ